MAYILVGCPNCGRETPFDDSMLECHCIRCGYRIPKDSVDLASCAPLEASGGSRPEDGLFAVSIESREKRIGYAIYVDGEQVMKTVGGHDTIRVTPGKHVLKVVSDMQTASVDLDVDSDIRLTVVTGFGGMRIKRV